MRLKDKVAIVTGSSKGIGEGIARIFYQEGAMVVIVGRNVDAGLKMALELGSEEGRSLFVKTDVRKSQEIREMIDKTVATFGKIDIVVNNVGYHISKNVVETSEEEWEFIQETNLRSTFLCSKYTIPHLKKTRALLREH